jgi:hypothetical protein
MGSGASKDPSQAVEVEGGATPHRSEDLREGGGGWQESVDKPENTMEPTANTGTPHSHMSFIVLSVCPSSFTQPAPVRQILSTLQKQWRAITTDKRWLSPLTLPSFLAKMARRFGTLITVQKYLPTHQGGSDGHLHLQDQSEENFKMAHGHGAVGACSLCANPFSGLGGQMGRRISRPRASLSAAHRWGLHGRHCHTTMLGKGCSERCACFHVLSFTFLLHMHVSRCSFFLPCSCCHCFWFQCQIHASAANDPSHHYYPSRRQSEASIEAL